MNTTIKRNIAVVLAMVSISLKAFSYYEPHSTIMPLKERFQVLDSREELVSAKAHRLIGHMSLAMQSMDWKFKDSSLTHLARARQQASSMLNDLKNTPAEVKGMAFSKMDMDKTTADYYAPVIISEIVTQDVEEEVRFKHPRAEVKQAKIVTVTMSLNMKETLATIQKAEELIKQDNYLSARSEISQVMQGGLKSETVVEDPTFVVWANLMLANDFLQSEEYQSARFTLKKAQQNLAMLEKNKTIKKDSQQVQELQTELDHMNKIINERSPTMIMKARNKIKQWSSRIKSWV